MSNRDVHRPRRLNRQRGSAMLIALIAVGGLITLGGITVLSVQGGLSAVSHDRHRSVALYAAESGGAAAMVYLRAHVAPAPTYWSALVNPRNVNPAMPAEIIGNGALPSAADNVFSDDINAWYEVELLNNLDDNGYVTGDDNDGIVVIRSTGHGPNGTTAQIEWRVQPSSVVGNGRPCPSYGQRGVAEDGAGRNDCLGSISSLDTAIYRPGS